VVLCTLVVIQGTSKGASADASCIMADSTKAATLGDAFANDLASTIATLVLTSSDSEHLCLKVVTNRIRFNLLVYCFIEKVKLKEAQVV
jgi:hypothetical protein